MVQSQEGILYLLTERGLSLLDPASYQAPLFKGPVTINGLKVGEQAVKGESLRLDNRSDVIEIRYGAVCLTDASRLEFRTRVGDERAPWSPPTSARSVRLSNLAPGNYRFEVAVRHQGQPWLTETASLALEVPPIFTSAPG